MTGQPQPHLTSQLMPAGPLPTKAYDFIRSLYPRLRNYLAATGSPYEDAEEIANDGSLIVLDRWDRLRADPRYDGCPPRAYLFKVATRLRSRRARTSKFDWRPLDPDDLEFTSAALAILSLEELEEPAVDRLTAAAVVRQTLTKMRLPDREVLWIRLAEDFSTADTATILRIPPNTVRTRLRVATMRFKDLVTASGALAGTRWDVTR
ncbi:sigma-70 family RNA polymerase sigma factor [Thermopolyspora sp. NPDC052614]|uniref:RNA polymerase sigma factor n=1 Tax=Thermopolyspora sp. NPDC052614 TaxID=3155682 RepID=UPI00343816CE